MIKPLVGTSIKPNHVTTVRLLVGIAAAGSLAIGDGLWTAIGAGLFVLSAILDRADGELARLTNMMSPGGHQYDLIADAICNTLILIGLGIGLRESSIGDWAILYGAIAGLSVAAILWMVIQLESLGGQRSGELPSFAGFDVDDLILLIPLGIWLGWSEPLLIAGALFTPLVALVYVVMFIRAKRKEESIEANINSNTVEAILALCRRGLVSWVEQTRRFAAPVVLTAIIFAAVTAVYFVQNIKINTNTGEMLSAELPYRKLTDKIDRLFPQYSDNILVVIDGVNPDLVDDAADRLVAHLRNQPKTFGSVYDPVSLDFFRQNGLLYLSLNELFDLTDRLAEAQPFLGTLWKDPSLRGLFNLISLAIEETLKEENKKGEAGKAPIEISTVLDAMAEVIEAQAEKKFARLSWQNLMRGKPNTKSVKRRFILLKPALDFSSIQPATAAMATLRTAIKSFNLIPAHGVRVRLSGSAALAQEELKSVKTGMGIAAVLSLTLVLSLLIIGLRSVRLVVATIVTLIIGLIWTAGFAVVAIGQLNLMSVAFAVLFIGLSVDFGIHFSLRYQEEININASHARALEKSTESVGGSLVMCAIAAAIAFFAFLPTDYVGLAELGLIAGTGMFIALFANLTVLPALLTLMPLSVKQFKLSAGGIFPHVLPYVRTNARSVIIGCLVLGVAAGYLLPKAHFDFDPLNLRDPKTESLSTLLELVNDTQTSPYRIKILARDLIEAEKLSLKLKALTVVKDVATINSFIPSKQSEKIEAISDIALLLMPALSVAEQEKAPSFMEQKVALKKVRQDLQQLAKTSQNSEARSSANRLIKSFGSLEKKVAIDQSAMKELQIRLIATLPNRLLRLKKSLQAKLVTLKDIPVEIRSRYVASDGRVRLNVNPKENIRNRDALLRFVDSVRAVVPEAVGPPVVIYESSRTVIKAFMIAALIAFISITVLLLVVLKSIRDSLFVFAPITLAALLTVAISVVFKLPFNFANVIVLPLLFGLGVASGIHFILRERDEVGSSGVLLTSTPRAVVFSALTTIGSFGSIALSSHPGTASMGVLLTIAITLTLICTLLVLPALMALSQNK